jgi:tetratricopeptide (TPR) repeat protein
MDRAAKVAPLAGEEGSRTGEAAAPICEAVDRALDDFDLDVEPSIADDFAHPASTPITITGLRRADADMLTTVDLATEDPAVIGSRGEARLRRGDAVGALADFNRVLEIDPSSRLARVNRAAARLQLGDHLGAQTDCDQVLSDDPKNRDAAGNRATARIWLEDFAGAADDSEIVLDVEPGSVGGLYLRALARSGLKQFPAALTDLNEVVKQDPALATGWASRANVKYHLGDATAVADYREAFRRDAAGTTNVLLRLVANQAKSRPAEVLAECQRFRERRRDDIVSLVRRGLTRMIQGRTAEAEKDFNTFRTLAPDGRDILEMLIAAIPDTGLSK